MLSPVFKTARKLANKVDAYFRYIEGAYNSEIKAGKEEKKHTREPEPATLTGLALFIGFNSLIELYDYEQNGEFADVISRGCLQVQSAYEKKLHQQSSSGAIYALKNLMRKEKGDHPAPVIQKINIEAVTVETGYKIASNESEVTI